MRRFSLLGLRGRLLGLVLLAVLPAVALILYSASDRRQHDIEQAQDDALRLARQASAEFAQLIDRTRQLLIVLAQVPDVRDGDGAACSALASDLILRFPVYANIGGIERHGDVFCSAARLDGRVSLADREYFRDAIATRNFAVGDVQIGRITGRPGINFGFPVLDSTGNVHSVVFASLDLAWLWQLAAESRLPGGSTLTVVDRNGRLMVRYPDDDATLGRSLAGDPTVRTALSGRQGVTEATADDGAQHLYAFAPLGDATDDAGAVVIVSIPRSIVVADADEALTRNLVLLGGVCVVALAAAWIASDVFVLRQVRALVRATRRLSDGDLSARTGVASGRGELSQLARAFDEMAESLQRHEELRRLAEQREAELRQAARVQAELLPVTVPALAGFELAARCVPAREVGGDFYDWQDPAPGILVFTLGDVMGKGMAAALLTATVRAALRAAVRLSPAAVAAPAVGVGPGPEPSDSGAFVALFHAQLIESAASAIEPDLTRSGSFATLFHARLDIATHRVDYVDAGHGCVFVRRAGGQVEELRPRGLPLGVLPDPGYQAGSTVMWPGDVLVVYSDGLIDANPELELTSQRIGARIADDTAAREIVEQLIALPALTGPPPDDLTVLVLRCLPEYRA
jgi:serine phosphatase RsbU (regulator of sigma subunit)